MTPRKITRTKAHRIATLGGSLCFPRAASQAILLVFLTILSSAAEGGAVDELKSWSDSLGTGSGKPVLSASRRARQSPPAAAADLYFSNAPYESTELDRKIRSGTLPALTSETISVARSSVKRNYAPDIDRVYAEWASQISNPGSPLNFLLAQSGWTIHVIVGSGCKNSYSHAETHLVVIDALPLDCAMATLDDFKDVLYHEISHQLWAQRVTPKVIPGTIDLVGSRLANDVPDLLTFARNRLRDFQPDHPAVIGGLTPAMSAFDEGLASAVSLSLTGIGESRASAYYFKFVHALSQKEFHVNDLQDLSSCEAFITNVLVHYTMGRRDRVQKLISALTPTSGTSWDAFREHFNRRYPEESDAFHEAENQVLDEIRASDGSNGGN